MLRGFDTVPVVLHHTYENINLEFSKFNTSQPMLDDLIG